MVLFFTAPNLDSTNWFFRTVFHEFPWSFGYIGIGAYLIGIMYVDIETQQLMPRSKQSSQRPAMLPKTLDTLGWIIVIIPFVIANSLALLSGWFRDRKDEYLA